MLEVAGEHGGKGMGFESLEELARAGAGAAYYRVARGGDGVTSRRWEHVEKMGALRADVVAHEATIFG